MIRRPFPLGSALTLDHLQIDPHPYLARLREMEPVSWVPVLDGWLVTRRDLCVDVMRDAATFTVDDPRFSTAQVVGPSMLSLDGEDHSRHRDPFASAFRLSEVRERFTKYVTNEARAIVMALKRRGTAEIRRDLAGPLAVSVVAAALDLIGVDPGTLLAWYDEIVAAVDRVSAGGEVGVAGRTAFDSLALDVARTIANGDGVLSQATATLTTTEVVSNAAVMLFGGIETSEGMTTTLFWHLLTNPDQLQEVLADRSLVGPAIEESLRLEPAAGRVDRYATRATELGGTEIEQGDLVIVSLSGANRDPAIFPQPDDFDLHRPNSKSHLAFAQGPHACVGIHLARLEARSALEAALEGWPALALAGDPTPPTGLVFRKARSLPVRWMI